MRTRLTIAVAVLASTTTFAQGEKHFLTRHNLSVHASANMPLLSGGFKTVTYKPDGETMKEGKDWLDYGFSASYVYQLKPRLALGIQASAQFLEVKPVHGLSNTFLRGEGFSATDSVHIRMEDVTISKFSYMPVLELQPKNSTGLLGMYYRIGLGYSLSSVQKGGYAYSVQLDENTWTATDYYNYEEEWEKMRSFQFLFGMGMRSGITDHLFLDFGINYNFALGVKPSQETLQLGTNRIFHYHEVYYGLSREQLMYLTANLGLSFTF